MANTQKLTLVAMTFITIACGNDPGSAGAPNVGSGIAGSENRGGVPGAGSRSASSSGAAGDSSQSASSGGAALGNAGSSSGGDLGLSNCPEWPASQLMPLVGLFFYGPDPGPCSSTTQNADGIVVENSTYGYVGEQLTSITRSDGFLELYDWTDGKITAGTYDGGYGVVNHQYSYAEGRMVDAYGSSSETAYTLSERGYPLSVTVGVGPDLAVRTTAKYEYLDCRLTRRLVYTDGTLQRAQTATYLYDEADRIVAREFDDGQMESLDYSCW